MSFNTFDALLARELADAFSASTGLGCTVKQTGSAQSLCDFGYTCNKCVLRRISGCDEHACELTHLYGLEQARRFGGRYIYFCRHGLTFFVSPIIGEETSSARVTVGPFLMVEPEDFCACELEGREDLLDLVKKIPFVEASRATQLSTLLYMSAGYLSSVSAVESLHENHENGAIQGQISAYIMELKQTGDAISYPFDMEQDLLDAMASGNHADAEQLMSRMLSHILIASGSSLPRAKSYASGLMTVMIRSILQHTDDPALLEKNMLLFDQEIHACSDITSLCSCLMRVMHTLMDGMFKFKDARHADALHRAVQYIRTHLADHLDLETLAGAACLSPSYFSRIFREETGISIQQAIMDARLKRACELIEYGNLRLSDIGLMVGFQDQSYFSRAFQKAYGVTPSQYRRSHQK